MSKEKYLKQGYDFLEEKQYEKALIEFEQAIKYGSATAFNNIAFMHSRGLGGLKKDDIKAFDCYKKGAELGCMLCHCQMGYLFEKGIGTKQNHKEAYNWYKKTHELTCCIEAKYNLAECYLLGKGVQQDIDKANNMFKELHVQLKEQKDPDLLDYMHAKTLLGSMYARGYGIKKDFDKGIEILKKESSKGDFDNAATAELKDLFNQT